MRSLLSLATIFLLIGLATSSAAPADRPPNIVMLYADDLGWGDVGFNGRKEWRTPNLDRLARQGTTFKRWYTAGVVCAPSRAALLTGKYGIHNGVSGNGDDLPREEVTLAEALKRHGYVTGLFGKWHHGRTRPNETTYVHPMDQGFDEFFGYTNARHAWEKYPNELWQGRELKPSDGYADTLFTNRAIDFMERHRDRPFFLYVPYVTTHFYVAAPQDEINRQRQFAERDESVPLNRAYAAMVTQMDREIGRILKALKKLGLEEDTLVVFSSDHGATFETGNKGTSNFHDSNHPFRGQKRTLWEGGIRVPGIVRWPGKVPSRLISHDLVHMTDLLPTFLAAAGQQPDPAWKVDGRNLLPVWRGKERSPDRTLFWEWRAEGYNQIAAMRGDMKLVSTGALRPELFNVVEDPGERRNIAAEHPRLASSLRRELEAWLATETEASKFGKPRAKRAAGSPAYDSR